MASGIDIAEKAVEFAEDDSHGYSQRPPNGRWGPDYDCSSLIYEIANLLGFDVGRGNEDGKVRFTGTMLKDFKDAGFQILPFANVGLGDLEIGDILLNLALHAEVYVGEGQSVGALSAEDGSYSGEAGDQTGQEITKHPVYEFDKGWDYVLRTQADTDDGTEEDQGGQEEMAYPYSTSYGNWGNTWQPGNGMSWTRPTGSTIPMQNYGYPQGNMGQMNGYSQANAGGYQMPNGQQGYYGNQQTMPSGPQGSGRQLNRVHGMEGARNFQMGPNECDALFDDNENIMYIKSTDQQGFPSIRVFSFEECSENMPQHMPLGGMMDTAGEFVSRREFEELKEMILNGQQSVPASGQHPDSKQSAGQGKSSNRNS